jgi:ABC-2 type transport system ATP-binding protein
MKAIEIKNLIKTYKGGVKALKDISLSVEEGDFFALLGPNGAGKSTTIGILSNLVNKTGGKVKIFEHDIDTQKDKAKTFIGLVPQEFNLNIFETVGDIIINQAGYYGIPRDIAYKRAEKLLKKLNLWDKKETPSMALSGGMKRKLMIIRALIHEPKLLILDEPTAGVDVETRRDMWEFLKELNKKGTTIVLTTHYLEEAENLCENIAIIGKGELIANTSMKELLSSVDKETFILDTKKNEIDISNIPAAEKIDNQTIKLVLPKNETLNEAISKLDKAGVEILSLKNESNRLEELFINLTKDEL